MQNDVGLILGYMAQLCRDDSGRLDKDTFRVLALAHFCFLNEQGLCDDALTKEFDSHLRRMLGPGHTLVSCIQFAHGKKGRAAREKCKAIAAQYLAQLSKDLGG